MLDDREKLIENIESQAQAYWDFMTQEEREEYAWLAGIIDGEGSIIIYHAHKDYLHRLKLQIRMTHRPTLEKISAITGIKFRRVRENHSRRKPYFGWEVSGETAASILRRCLSTLTTKRAQALIGIALVELQKTYMRRVSPAFLAKEESLHQAMSALNQEIGEGET